MLIEVRFKKSGERILSAGSLEFLDEVVGHVIDLFAVCLTAFPLTGS